jgi:hypothetical protein
MPAPQRSPVAKNVQCTFSKRSGAFFIIRPVLILEWVFLFAMSLEIRNDRCDKKVSASPRITLAK